MRDAFWLLATAVVCASGAWAFWSFLGNDAFSVFSTIVLLVVASDNVRLRRKLRDQKT